MSYYPTNGWIPPYPTRRMRRCWVPSHSHPGMPPPPSTSAAAYYGRMAMGISLGAPGGYHIGGGPPCPYSASNYANPAGGGYYAGHHPPTATYSSIWPHNPSMAAPASYRPTSSSGSGANYHPHQQQPQPSSMHSGYPTASVPSNQNNGFTHPPSASYTLKLNPGNLYSGISSLFPLPPPPNVYVTVTPSTTNVHPRPRPSGQTSTARQQGQASGLVSNGNAPTQSNAAAAAAAVKATVAAMNPPPPTPGMNYLTPPSPALNMFLPPSPVTPSPLVPPQWQELYDDTSISLSSYKTFPIDPTSLEYQTITEMLNPIHIISAEKIVNPELWQRYTNTRKEMIRSKSDDLALLSKLGLDDKEAIRCAHHSLNFIKDPQLVGSYSPNEVLLFHCTRNSDNLQRILSQGLDERLSASAGGLLGKGIYFADDPQKSVQYDGGTGIILIFSVLLGDCLDVDHFPNTHTFVREPEKTLEERRNFNDQFFDSITARPSTSAHNEYVIYNRYQCCPLYQIQYQRQLTGGNIPTDFDIARHYTPTVAWRNVPGTNYSMPNQTVDGEWPFYAANLFEKMGVLPPSDPDPVNNDHQHQQQPYVPADANYDTGDTSMDNPNVDDKLAALESLGFSDDAKNREILQLYENNLNLAANFFLDGDGKSQPSSEALPPQPQPSTSAACRNSRATSKSKTPTKPKRKKAKLTANERTPVKQIIKTDSEDREECSICFDDFLSSTLSPSTWKTLKCGHKLCVMCYQYIEKTRYTMSMCSHTFEKCPFCQDLTGMEVGDCPTGIMTVTTSNSSCDGYPGRGSIAINYLIDSDDYELDRTAYLPNTKKGNEILELLKTAWDRRLTFTIGTSATTGAQNVLVWNIHHKTALNGGIESHGYPDPGYLDRVREELKTHGIE